MSHKTKILKYCVCINSYWTCTEVLNVCEKLHTSKINKNVNSFCNLKQMRVSSIAFLTMVAWFSHVEYLQDSPFLLAPLLPYGPPHPIKSMPHSLCITEGPCSYKGC